MGYGADGVKRDGGVSVARLRGKVTETGQEVTIDAPRRRKRKKGWRDKVGLVDLGIMKKLELSALEYRVLFCVMDAIPEKGGCRAFVTNAEIAEEIQSTTPSVSRTLVSLRDRRIVLREGTGRLVVNPWIMYNGDFDSWDAETKDFEEPIWVRADMATGEVRG